MAGSEDDVLAALTEDVERTDPRLACSLRRFRPGHRPLRWAAALLLVAALPVVGWLLDTRVVVGAAIALVLVSPLVVAAMLPRSAPPGGATP
jgi:hypothetical protein